MDLCRNEECRSKNKKYNIITIPDKNIYQIDIAEYLDFLEQHNIKLNVYQYKHITGIYHFGRREGATFLAYTILHFLVHSKFSSIKVQNNVIYFRRTRYTRTNIINIFTKISYIDKSFTDNNTHYTYMLWIKNFDEYLKQYCNKNILLVKQTSKELEIINKFRSLIQ